MKTVSKICKELMIKEPFYGFFFLGLNKRFSISLPTAGVYLQGINFALDINQEYWMSLDENRKLGLIKHELLHLCFSHLFMMRSFKDKQLFNIAADLEVNQYIDPNNVMPNWVLMSSFPDIQLEPFAGTKYYYEKLQKNLESDNPSQNLLDLLGQGDCSGDCDSNSDGSSSGNGSGKAFGKGAGTCHSTWEDFDKLTDTEKSLIKSQIEYQLKESANQAKGRGTIPGEMSTIISELFKVKKPIFNWKAYFRRLLGSSFKVYTKKSQRKLSKRFEGSAGLKIKKKQNILVGIDTSGSVSDKELLDFFSEIKHIYNSGTSVTIVECDARIHSIYEYKGVFKGSVTGRGGTEFIPVIDYYNNNRSLYTTLIYFTDGYCPVDNFKVMKKMVWVITSNGSDQKFPGYTIRIPKSN